MKYLTKHQREMIAHRIATKYYDMATDFIRRGYKPIKLKEFIDDYLIDTSDPHIEEFTIISKASRAYIDQKSKLFFLETVEHMSE